MHPSRLQSCRRCNFSAHGQASSCVQQVTILQRLTLKVYRWRLFVSVTHCSVGYLLVLVAHGLCWRKAQHGIRLQPPTALVGLHWHLWCSPDGVHYDSSLVRCSSDSLCNCRSPCKRNRSHLFHRRSCKCFRTWPRLWHSLHSADQALATSWAHQRHWELRSYATNADIYLAEREGFEPPGLLTLLFSRQAHSAALPPFRPTRYRTRALTSREFWSANS